jgi:hypothetical protein
VPGCWRPSKLEAWAVGLLKGEDAWLTDVDAYFWRIFSFHDKLPSPLLAMVLGRREREGKVVRSLKN